MKRKLILSLFLMLSVMLMPTGVFASETEAVTQGGSTAGNVLWIMLFVLVFLIIVYMIWNIIRSRKEAKYREAHIKPRLVIIQHRKK